MIGIVELIVAGASAYSGAVVCSHLDKPEKKKKSDKARIKLRHYKKFKEYVAQKSKTLRKFMFKDSKKGIDLLLGDNLRQEQLKELSGNEEKTMTESEKRIEKRLKVSLASLGISALGNMIYFPLNLLSVPGLLYVTSPIFKNAYQALFTERKVRIHTLTSFMLVSCIFEQYFFIANLTGFFFVYSRKMLSRIKDESEKQIIDVFRQQPRFAWLMTNDILVKTPIEKISIDDVVVVGSGECIPVDGVIIDGIASVDQHILTGESQPTEKEIGGIVFASTTVLSGRICIKVQKAGHDTTVAQIGEILNKTVHLKADLQTKAEDFIDKAALPTLLASAIALPFIGIVGAASVLNNRLGYRVLIVTSIGTLNHLQLISKNGILIKDGRVLDLLAKVDTIVFDKTGTLTLSKFSVAGIHRCSHYDADEILAYAAASEQRHSHPIAAAIVEEADKRHVALPPSDQSEYSVGYGIKILIDKEYVYVGSDRFMEREGISIPSSIAEIIGRSHSEGNSVVLIARSESLIGAIELAPMIRPEAALVIQQIKKRNMGKIYIISGDHEIPTKKLAEKLGIDHYFAEILPHQKAEIIENLQTSGKTVCFIGDGINDAIALKKAQVSISLRGASTVATDTAQIILMNENLDHLLYIFDQAEAHDKTLRNCLATIIAASAVGLAGVVFWDFGLVTTTILRVVSMSGSLGFAMLPLKKLSKQEE